MKTELWNGHEIRFVLHKDEWWAIAVDVTKALDLGNTTNAIRRLNPLDKTLISIKGLDQSDCELNIISEFGIYKLIMTSRKPEAREFERWVFGVIKELRGQSGLEGFQIFRMLDKEHQVKMMQHLSEGLKEPKRIDFVKANTITNKAVSSANGYPKMVKKGDMTPGMLVQRQPILEDTVNLMTANDSFDLGLSVSQKVYEKYSERIAR